MRTPEAPRTPPAGRVVVERRWKYAPPPWVMYEAIVEDHARWLAPLADESPPKIVASLRPEGAVFSPWVDPAVSAVEVRIERLPDSGAALTVLAYSEGPELTPDQRRRVRYRLGTLFGAALRDWVDEPHRSG